MSVNRHSYVGFYPSDWLAGTARMTRMHKSVYFDICCYIWDHNAACPAAELPLMLGDVPGWRDLVQDLVEAGKIVRAEDGSLCNERALSEAKKAFDLWEKKSSGGKRGAAKTNGAAGSGDGTPAGSGDGSSPKRAGSPDAEPEPEPEPTTPNPFGDLNGQTAKCLRASGVAVFPTQPDRFATQLDVVRQWIESGLSIDDDVIPMLEREAVTNPNEKRHSLAYFGPSVARVAAQRSAKAKGATGVGHPSGLGALIAAAEKYKR